MVKGEFEEEEVEEMRGALVHEGWEASPALPKSWMMRGPTGSGKYHNSLKFVNEAGTKFESTRAAIEHVKSENPANLVDIQKLCKFNRQLASVSKELERAVAAKKVDKDSGVGRELVKARALLRDIESKESEGVYVLAKKANKEMDSGDKCDKKVKLVKQPTNGGWREDDMLPKGWKTKGKISKPVKGKADYEAFLSPSGKQLSSRLALIDQLKKEGVDCEWIDRARSGLVQLGWVQEPRLPQGFLRRDNLGSKVEFYTPQCKRVEGQAKLLELLLQEGYSFKVGYSYSENFRVQMALAKRTSLLLELLNISFWSPLHWCR